ncbi:MAG: acetylglutamate kinase [Pseudomonadota bacterium]
MPAKPTATEEDAAKALAAATTLAEALPFIQRYDGEAVLIKYGGHAMGDPELSRMFARDVALLKQVGLRPIVVHGGGPQIGAMLKRLNIESEFVDGHRVTDQATVEIAEMVLAGSINKAIVADITAAGGAAVGLSGKDGGLITARKAHRARKDPSSHIEKALDLGFVGEPERVDASVLDAVMGAGLIPIIAPIGLGADGQTYNINADTAAGAIAAAIGAKRLLLLSDVDGVLDAGGALIREITVGGAEALIASGAANGGMIPKLETCIKAVGEGVEAAVILDGRRPHAVLLELFTQLGAGTLMEAGRA